jgi:hypothetical protein
VVSEHAGFAALLPALAVHVRYLSVIRALMVAISVAVAVKLVVVVIVLCWRQ